MSAAASALSLVFPVMLLWAMASDVARFEIPNAIPLTLAGVFAPCALLGGAAAGDLLWHAGTAFAVLAVGALLFFGGLLGGGDAKLIAAATLWVGPHALPAFLLTMALAGGVLALVLVLFRLLPEPSWAPHGGWLRRLHGRRRDAPYGVAIGGAGLLWFLDAGPIVG